MSAFIINLKNQKELFTNKLISLYNDKSSCDFSLKLPDNSKLRAHMFILIARSDYFKSLIDSPMIESSNFKISINGTRGDANIKQELF